jgi:hypothetical protein
MLSSMKKILSEYKVLINKMVENNVVNEMAKMNYKFLCDVETLWAWLVCYLYWNFNVWTLKIHSNAWDFSL